MLESWPYGFYRVFQARPSLCDRSPRNRHNELCYCRHLPTPAAGPGASSARKTCPWAGNPGLRPAQANSEKRAGRPRIQAGPLAKSSRARSSRTFSLPRLTVSNRGKAPPSRQPISPSAISSSSTRASRSNMIPLYGLSATWRFFSMASAGRTYARV